MAPVIASMAIRQPYNALETALISLQAQGSQDSWSCNPATTIVLDEDSEEAWEMAPAIAPPPDTDDPELQDSIQSD